MNKILLNCHDIVILTNAGGSDFGQNSHYIKSYKICFNNIITESCSFGRCKRLCQAHYRGLYLDSWCMDDTDCKCKYSC